MQLAKDITRALRKRRGEWWRARGLPLKIARGQTNLASLRKMAKHAGRECSLTYMLSGGRYDTAEDMPLADAIARSIMHAGKDKHDVARAIGFRDYNYLRHQIVTETLQVKVFLKLCEAICRQPWEVTCDGEYALVEDPNAEPSQWEQMVELDLMGWLDAPIHKETR